MEEAATQGQTGFDPRFFAGVCKQVPTGVVAVQLGHYCHSMLIPIG
jgi:hypothetical protein